MAAPPPRRGPLAQRRRRVVIARSPSFDAILEAIKAHPARPVGLERAAYTYGGADGERRDQVWAMCPACGWYGLHVERLPNGRASVSCRNGTCTRDQILEALARALLERARSTA